MKKLFNAMAILMVLLAASFVASVKADEVTGVFTFVATLSGSEETPQPVDTEATGTCTFDLYYIQDETTGDLIPQLDYEVTLKNIEGVTAGHIHRGPRGVSGPIIIPFPGITDEGVSGTATPTDEHIHDIIAGNTYCNVHTSAHPGGEIRGQIMRAEK